MTPQLFIVELGCFAVSLIGIILLHAIPIGNECSVVSGASNDCFGYACLSTFRCNCTAGDFANIPAYRNYRCDPAGLVQPFQVGWVIFIVPFLIGLLLVCVFDIKPISYIKLEPRIVALEGYIKRKTDD